MIRYRGWINKPKRKQRSDHSFEKAETTFRQVADAARSTCTLAVLGIGVQYIGNLDKLQAVFYMPVLILFIILSGGCTIHAYICLTNAIPAQWSRLWHDVVGFLYIWFFQIAMYFAIK
jgi:hypothetical protein